MRRPRRGRCVARLAGQHARLPARTATRGSRKIDAREAAWEAELDGWTHEKDRVVARESRRARRTCIRARCCASSSARCRTARWSRPTSATSARCRNSYLRFERPRSMFAAMSFGNCGYAFPTIIGAKVAAPDRPAIAYVGDGAWGMSFGELQTCVREKIPVTAVVFNNGQWGAEKKNHVDFYANRFLGVNLDKQPSWAAVAQGDGRRRRARSRSCPTSARRCARRRGAARRQDDGARDDGDARARRSVPPRCAGDADAASRQVQVDRGAAPLRTLRMRRRLSHDTCFCVVASCALAALGHRSAPARSAQDWPTKPIRMIVPYPPAGGTDVVARIAQRAAGARCSAQPIVIENKGGAAGNLGTDIAAKAPPTATRSCSRCRRTRSIPSSTTSCRSTSSATSRRSSLAAYDSADHRRASERARRTTSRS